MYCMISENTRVLLDASKREFEVKSMLLRYISVLFLALKVTLFVTIIIRTKTNLFLFGCSEVNSTWLITSELANQHLQKVLFTCVVYANLKTTYNID